MDRTRRTIGISAFVILAVLSTSWALERGYSNRSQARGTAIDEPASSDADASPVSNEPMDEPSPTTDSTPEYDRSDLILSQG